MDVPGKFSPHTQQSGPGKGSTCCKQLWQTGTREMRVSGEKQIRQSEGKKTAKTLSATARSTRRAPGNLLGNRSALHGVRVRVRPPIRLKTTLPRKACRSRRIQYSRVVQGCAIEGFIMTACVCTDHSEPNTRQSAGCIAPAAPGAFSRFCRCTPVPTCLPAISPPSFVCLFICRAACNPG
jgi:hypothetical protein